MSPHQLGLCFALAAGLAAAQGRAALEIRGVVLEPGSVLGVAGAEVTLYEFVREADNARIAFATASTDLNGAFRFHPPRLGDYYVEVKKTGYVSSYSFNGATTPLQESTGTLLSLSRDRPSRDVRLSLMRPGELTGRVIDEDGNPAAGVTVEVLNPGASLLSAGAIAATAKDGSFTATKLRPGEYLVRISSWPDGMATAVPQFSEADAKVVDQRLATSYWPGVSDEQSAYPVLVSPGSTINVGTITAVKVPAYRVRVSVPGDCRPDDMWEFFAFDDNGNGTSMRFANRASFFTPSFSPVSCQDFLVRDLRPGSYQFALRNARGWAVAAVDITTSNLDLALTITPDTDVYGRVIAAEGARLPPLDTLKIELKPSNDMVRPGPAPSTVADGRFLFKSVRGLRHQVVVRGLGRQYYVKEVRTDGRVAADGVVTPSEGSQLEIVIDDQPAVLSGSVTEGGKPVSQPIVYLTKWPMSSLNPIVDTTGDNDGRFQITGLAPGEYRVLAVLAEPIADGLELTKDILPRLWYRAEQLTLKRGGSRTLALKLADPWR
jgi:5-hydroxyisourate hydrolase-like protein (transthyretin family)